MTTPAIDKRQILETVKTIAVVGLSSREGRPGYYVPAYMQRAGYRITPYTIRRCNHKVSR